MITIVDHPDARHFHLPCDDPEIELRRTRPGCEFAAGVESGHVSRVPRHPEQSPSFSVAGLDRFAATRV